MMKAEGEGMAETSRDSKYMEFLQTAIARMAGNSFLIKGWSITITTVVLGLAVKEGGPAFALLGLLPIMLFWSLDAYYLALEKSFRSLFDTAALAYVDGTVPEFAMDPTVGGVGGVIKCMVRPATHFVHLTLVIALVVAFVVLKCR